MIIPGHAWSTYQEAEKAWLEILEIQQHSSKRLEKTISERQATLDYFQRLKLLARVAQGEAY